MIEQNTDLPAQRCHIRACGAVVLLVPVRDGELAVDPQPVELAVPAADGRYHLETGYRPHWTTCADITGRARNRVRLH